MERSTELEAKYQKLAAEYSKVRSQASVLKKAVLDEQAKSLELKELNRKHEQTIRKHDQEMESLTFRNEQLTKRISVLQQELQVNSYGKKGKPKTSSDNKPLIDIGILDEEFEKKILENAQLLSSISDKDLEIVSYKDRIEWLEEKITNLEKELLNRDGVSVEKFDKLEKENERLNTKLKEMMAQHYEKSSSILENHEKILNWESEVEKLRVECDLLRHKPSSNEQLTEYYETQLRIILESKTLALSETKSLLAENQALKLRLENIILELVQVQNKLEKSREELLTTNENYKTQLDAMTEHLAGQNEKITSQCDEIQMLKHKLMTKK